MDHLWLDWIFQWRFCSTFQEMGFMCVKVGTLAHKGELVPATSCGDKSHCVNWLQNLVALWFL